jgi:hypothetical protein
VVVSSTPTPLALLTNLENKFSVTFRRALGGAYLIGVGKRGTELDY